jgi:hypothetical protein
MPGLCRAPGCDSPTTSRYSVYCSRHQSRLRRQGDVAQKAISKAELKTYLKRSGSASRRTLKVPLGVNLRPAGWPSSSTRRAWSRSSVLACCSRSIRICCATAADMRWRTLATTRGPSRRGWVMPTSSIRLGTRSLRRRGSRASGDREEPRPTLSYSGPPRGPRLSPQRRRL